MLVDLLSLLSGAVAIFVVKRAAGFWLSVVFGLVLAALCWYGCYAFARLWNRGFHPKVTHHLLCAIAALIMLAFSILYPGISYIGDAGVGSIAVWEATIRRDSEWASVTFRKAYEAVRKLGIEDFREVPPPWSPQSWIPTTHNISRQEAAVVYASSACEHFARSRPFLSKVVWARPGVPAVVLFADVESWHRTNPTYPPERAVQLAAEQIRAGLIAQVPRLVTSFRLIALLLFLLAQAIPFGLVGWAAYRDIKVRA